MAYDEGVLSLEEQLKAAEDKIELDKVYETERHLFYAVCTGARDRLLISAVSPGSEFLRNLRICPLSTA